MRMAIARADTTTLLIRALRQSAGMRAVTMDVKTANAHPWASATFEGERHDLRLSVAGDDARGWLALLPDAELPIRGHIVADITVDEKTDVGGAIDATISALTIAER